jgi:LDH2 family malate/lactate/ureidoglycolate dehydrogenase
MSLAHASAATLTSLGETVLAACGADEASAQAATKAMVHASLHGVDSHGIRLLPFYAQSLRTGLVNARPAITVTRPRRAVALVDADRAMGHIACYRAMAEACAMARESGIGMATVIHSTHFGAAGAYALEAAKSGFIGFIAANSGAFVIPFGGTTPLHGTSPVAFASPNLKGDPFLVDMATSTIPWNKVLRYRTEGLPLPPDAAVDTSGTFTTDPHAAVALAPFGGSAFGYKGAAVAGIAEVLGGVLSGMRLSFEQDGKALGDSVMGHFLMAIDPTLFMSLEDFSTRLSQYIAAFRAQPGTYAAGGPEWEKRRRREAEGIPLPPGLLAELQAVAQSAGVTF